MSRDLRFDFVRGLALLGIAVNHTAPAREGLNQYGIYQFGHLFSFNFADVFVFISGCVCGMAYGRVLEQKGFIACQNKALRRSLNLGWVRAVTAALCLTVVYVANKGGVHAIIHEPTQHNYWTAYWQTAIPVDPIMHFTILPLYMVLLVFLPIMLWLYNRWGVWSLLIPAIPYIAVNIPAIRPVFGGQGPFFGIIWAWQFTFALGIVIGCAYKRGTLFMPATNWGVPIALMLLIAVDYLNQMQFVIHHFNNKITAGPARLMELLAVSYLFAKVVGRDSPLFSQPWARVIVICGQHSLFVFCSSLVIAYITAYTAEAMSVGRVGYGMLVIVTAVLTAAVGVFRHTVSWDKIQQTWKRDAVGATTAEDSTVM